MRRVVTLVLVLLLIPSVCFGAENEVVFGRLTKLNVAEDELVQDVKQYIAPFTSLKYFDTFNSLIAAARSGRIDAFAVDTYTAGYLLARTDQYVVFRKTKYDTSYSMLLLEDNTELCGKISSAIKEMKADGTLDALKKQYIEDCVAGLTPKP